MSQDGTAPAVPATGMLLGLPSEHVTLLTCTIHANILDIIHKMSHHGSLITSHVTDMQKGCQIPLALMQHRVPLDCNPLA